MCVLNDETSNFYYLTIYIVCQNLNIENNILSEEELAKIIFNLKVNGLSDPLESKNNNLFFTSDLNYMKNSDFFILTVPTPITNKRIDNAKPVFVFAFFYICVLVMIDSMG